MTYLLDTDTCIAYLTGRSDKVAQRLRELQPADVEICTVVKAELLFVALKSGRRAENLERVQLFLGPFLCHVFDDLAAESYARLRLQLERQGTPIGPNDLFIAAIALSRQCTVVTSNVREFGRITGLKVEDWLR
jgi:tRNA(fMet)-specific endonuclease VapC